MLRNPCCRRGAGPLALLICLLATPAQAIEIKLAHHPDYHNGKVVFSYLGDLWLVNEDGSNPQRLTVHPARDVHPRFSPDGKMIAFSSDRFGNYDVFVMPAEGGKAKQLLQRPATPSSAGRAFAQGRLPVVARHDVPRHPDLYEVRSTEIEQRFRPISYWGGDADGKSSPTTVAWRGRAKHSRQLRGRPVGADRYAEHRRIVDDTLPDDEKGTTLADVRQWRDISTSATA
jgi:dipeptidyl aminopeptidase/acylaminoacyl peptidase